MRRDVTPMIYVRRQRILYSLDDILLLVKKCFAILGVSHPLFCCQLFTWFAFFICGYMNQLTFLPPLATPSYVV
jgi:hypothetical protein